MSAWFTFECLAQYLKHHKIAVTINVMNNICEKHTFPGGLVVKELALSLLLASCHCCCSGPAPGLRMSACGGCSQKKKKKKGIHFLVNASQISFKDHALAPFLFSYTSFSSLQGQLMVISQCCKSINTFSGHASFPISHLSQSQLAYTGTEKWKQDLGFTEHNYIGLYSLCLASPSVYHQHPFK